MQFLWIMCTYDILEHSLYCHLIHINLRKFIMFFMMFLKVNNLKFAFFDLILLTCPLLQYKFSSGIYDQMQFDVNDLCQIASEHTIWEIASSVLLSYKVMSKV